MQVRDCGNYSGQRWSYDQSTYHLVNPPSGLCLDTAGAQLNTGVPTATPYSVAGFPPSKPVNLLIWNANADGLVAPRQKVTADVNGVVGVSISQHAVFVLTTVRLG